MPESTTVPNFVKTDQPIAEILPIFIFTPLFPAMIPRLARTEL